MARYQVIDVSHHNGVIDFDRVAAAGVWGVILKAGGSDAGTYKDSTFERNYNAAKKAGLHVGAYYYVGPRFLTKTDGRADANRFKKILAGKQFDLPVYLDLEEPPKGKKPGVTKAAISFCETMEEACYFTGIYGSDLSTFSDLVYRDQLEGVYTLWVARYGSAPKATRYDVWQYSSKGKIPGINGYVDLDYCYTDFPHLIRRVHKNGY